MWFFTLFTLSLLSIATSIFREQLGEYDRISTHFGFTERAVSHSGSIYAASREGVISSLRPESGVAQWRSFLPTNDHFHKFVIAENVLVTLSSIDLTEFYVRAWRLGSGTLQWEHRIVHQKMASDLITDMMYDSVRGALLVLLPNGVTFMDIKSPTVDFWQWPASESIVLTKLIDPTSSTGSLSSSARVAYGCKVDSSGVCKSTAVVSVSFETHQIAVDQFPSLGVSVNSLHGVISSDIADIESRKKDLLPEDVLFGVSTTEKGKDEAKPVIHVLSLTNDREDLYPLEISGRRSSLVVTTFTLAQPDASILPGVSICYTSISTGENEVQLCSAYALRRKTIGGKESWTMNSIFSGSPNQCASYKVNSMLLERSVAIQSFSYHESLISAVLNLDFCGTVDGVSTQLEGVVIDDRINAYFVELPMKLATEKSLKSFFPSKFPLLVSPSSPQLLVVSTDGLTTMLGSDTSGRMKVIWYYEAALSTIQQVIPFNLDENGGYDEIVQEVLLARERLNMQFDDFKVRQ